MTILVGADQTVNNGTPGNYTPQIYFQPFVAVATGTAATMSVRLLTTAGSVIIGIADSTRNVLGQTAQFTATTGLNTQNLAAGVSIVSGTTYNLFVAFATEAFPVIATDGTTTNFFEPYVANGGFTWPTIPSPFPAAANSDARGSMGIYASSSGSSVDPTKFFLGARLLPLAPLGWIIGRRNKIMGVRRSWRQDQTSRLILPEWKKLA